MPSLINFCWASHAKLTSDPLAIIVKAGFSPISLETTYPPFSTSKEVVPAKTGRACLVKIIQHGWSFWDNIIL